MATNLRAPPAERHGVICSGQAPVVGAALFGVGEDAFFHRRPELSAVRP